MSSEPFGQGALRFLGVNAILSGKKQAEVCQLFDISRAALNKLAEIYRESDAKGLKIG